MERRQEMLAHVAAQSQSGVGRKVYCEAHDLNMHVLNYWFAKSRRQGTAGFAAVEFATGSNVELHYPNGVRMLLPVGTALDHIAACIRLY